LADKATPTGFLSVTFLLPGQKKGNNWFPLDLARGMLFWLLFLCCCRQRKSNIPTTNAVVSLLNHCFGREQTFYAGFSQFLKKKLPPKAINSPFLKI